jgi:hypothetical protein
MDKIKYLTLERYKYSDTTTLGKLIVDGKSFCNTLEDVVRPFGIKIKSRTAIPENHMGYNVDIHKSNRFKRDVLIVTTEPDVLTLRFGGISFTHIYFHGGNTHLDTDGCILVARNVNVDKMTIQGTMEKELFNIVKGWITTGHVVKLIVRNKSYTDVT